MSDLEFYYQQILANSPAKTFPGVGESELLYKQLMEVLRKDYSTGSLDTQLQQIRSVLDSGVLHNNTAQATIPGSTIKLDLSDTEATTIQDSVFGSMKMYAFQGKYTVGGVIRYVDFEFAKHVKPFLDEIQAIHPAAKITSAYRTHKEQVAAAISISPKNPDHSNHRRALAVDVNVLGWGGTPDQNLKWFLSYSEKYGLYNKIPTDQVHLSYNGH